LPAAQVRKSRQYHRELDLGHIALRLCDKLTPEPAGSPHGIFHERRISPELPVQPGVSHGFSCHTHVPMDRTACQEVKCRFRERLLRQQTSCAHESLQYSMRLE
jgi:hypothetical protein